MRSKKLTKKQKRIIIIAAILTVLFVFISIDWFAGINYSSVYSENQHISRISKRIEKRFIQSGKATGFQIYPIYDEWDALFGFLVEFEPIGYLYVEINKRMALIGQPVFLPMYMLSNDDFRPWSPYVIKDNRDDIVDDCFIEDCRYKNVFWASENGKKIEYYQSPFAVYKKENEKKYLISAKYKGQDSGLFPAIKVNGVFVNLITLDEYAEGTPIDNRFSPYGGKTFFADSRLALR